MKDLSSKFDTSDTGKVVLPRPAGIAMALVEAELATAVSLVERSAGKAFSAVAKRAPGQRFPAQLAHSVQHGQKPAAPAAP